MQQRSVRDRLRGKLQEKATPAQELSKELIAVLNQLLKILNLSAIQKEIDQNNFAMIFRKIDAEIASLDREKAFVNFPSKPNKTIEAIVNYCKESLAILEKYDFEKQPIKIEVGIYNVLFNMTIQLQNIMQSINDSFDAAQLLKDPKFNWLKDNAEMLLHLGDILQFHSLIITIPYHENLPDKENAKITIKVAETLIPLLAEEHEHKKLNEQLAVYKKIYHYLTAKADANYNAVSRVFYHTYCSILAAQTNDLINGKKHLLKSRLEAEKLYEKGRRLSEPEIKLTLNLAEAFSKAGDDENSLLCYRIAKGYITKNMELFTNEKATRTYVFDETFKKFHSETLLSINDKTKSIKKKIIDKRKTQLIALLEKFGIDIIIENNSSPDIVTIDVTVMHPANTGPSSC